MSSPRKLRNIAQSVACALYRKQGIELAGSRTQWHIRKDLSHEVTVRAVHHRISSSDDERFRAVNIGLKPTPRTLRDIARIDVAPQIPFAESRILRVTWEALVIVGFHNVR